MISAGSNDAKYKCAAIKRRALAAKFLAANLDRLLAAQIARLVFVDGVRAVRIDRPRLRFEAWPLRVPQNHLVFEFNVESLVHALAHITNQRQHVVRGSRASVHEEIRMAIADARVAHIETLEAELINHAAGRFTRGIFENASGAFLAERLA